MLRLALFAFVVSTAALAQNAGPKGDAGGVTPLPTSGHPPPKGEGVDAGPASTHSSPAVDAGSTTPTPAPKPGGGSHCKMTRSSDNLVLAERNSAGSLMDCQSEVRAEALKTKECKTPHQRIDVIFTGDFNGIAIQPIEMHINCPKK